MIEVALWQLVLFVLAGVALGAVIMMVRVAKGRPVQNNIKTTAVAESLPATPSTIVDPAKVAEALSLAERRKGIIKDFLNKRIMSGRNITIDEAGKCLGVSPRRIRKLLDTNALVAIPIAGGGRRVSAVSVLDAIARRELVGQITGVEREPKPVPKPEPTEEKPTEAEVPPEEPPDTGKLEPNPNQVYWYYVAGYDKPCHDIREALAVLGMEYRFTSWRTIPAHIRHKMRREKI